MLESLYENKPFFVPNGGDIQSVEIKYKDWMWIENFITTTRLDDLERLEKFCEGMKILQTGKVKLDYAGGKEYEVEVESDRQIFYNQALSDLLSHLKEQRRIISNEE